VTLIAFLLYMAQQNNTLASRAGQYRSKVMNAVLIRCGIDQQYGDWNAPVDAEGNFVYVPIPEASGTLFHPGLGRYYGEILPALHRFCREHSCDLCRDLRFPQDLLNRAMHLDPDFECLTYGNPSNVKGLTLGGLSEGDLVVFYAGLQPVPPIKSNLIYALIGIFVVQEVVSATSVQPEQWYENAHVRKVQPGDWSSPGKVDTGLTVIRVAHTPPG
jgi:hypothetical protein